MEYTDREADGDCKLAMSTTRYIKNQLQMKIVIILDGDGVIVYYNVKYFISFSSGSIFRGILNLR